MAKTFSPNTCQKQLILLAVLQMPHASLTQCATSSLASLVNDVARPTHPPFVSHCSPPPPSDIAYLLPHTFYGLRLSWILFWKVRDNLVACFIGLFWNLPFTAIHRRNWILHYDPQYTHKHTLLHTNQKEKCSQNNTVLVSKYSVGK